MHQPNTNPFKYKNGKTEIEGGQEQRHHVVLMWFDICMKWMFRFAWLLIGKGALYFIWQLFR